MTSNVGFIQDSHRRGICGIKLFAVDINGTSPGDTAVRIGEITIEEGDTKDSKDADNHVMVGIGLSPLIKNNHKEAVSRVDGILKSRFSTEVIMPERTPFEYDAVDLSNHKSGQDLSRITVKSEGALPEFIRIKVSANGRSKSEILAEVAGIIGENLTDDAMRTNLSRTIKEYSKRAGRDAGR